MKYVEFEYQLQALLDERRFHEVDRLLTQVDPDDRSRCERLVAVYGTLFDGLESWNQPPGDAALADRVLQQLQTASPLVPPLADDAPPTYVAASAWMPIAALGLAASLLILAFVPFSLSQQRDDRIGDYVAATDANFPAEAPLEPLDSEDAQYVSAVRSPFDLPWDLTNDLVGATTSARRLPLDSTALAVTSLDASPWIDTVQNPFRPLTQSMGSALMVIKEVAIPNAVERVEPDAKPQARGARLPLSPSRRIT